jgi:hypothetical protein
VLQVAAGSGLLAGAHSLVVAQAPEKLTETDSYAKSMGFRYDTTKVDQTRYPRHDAATQQCSKCQLFSGKDGDEWGACSFFGDRLVKPTGWCRNFKAKKA